MKRKTYLAFDVDGTIFDSTGIIVDAFRSGISEFIKEKGSEEIKLPEYRQIVNVLGIPVDEIFRTLFPMLSEEEANILNDMCTESLVTMIRDGSGRVFEDVYSTMEALHGEEYILLAASNGRRGYIEAILETHGLMKFFSGPMAFIDGTIKDKSGIIRFYKEDVSGDGLLIMIGDRFTDREAASDNGIPFIGCAFGHAGDSELDGSRWTVKDFSQLPSAVKEIEESNR